MGNAVSERSSPRFRRASVARAFAPFGIKCEVGDVLSPDSLGCPPRRAPTTSWGRHRAVRYFGSTARRFVAGVGGRTASHVTRKAKSRRSGTPLLRRDTREKKRPERPTYVPTDAHEPSIWPPSQPLMPSRVAFDAISGCARGNRVAVDRISGLDSLSRPLGTGDKLRLASLTGQFLYPQDSPLRALSCPRTIALFHILSTHAGVDVLLEERANVRCRIGKRSRSRASCTLLAHLGARRVRHVRARHN